MLAQADCTASTKLMNDIHQRMLANRKAFHQKNRGKLSKLDLWEVLSPTMPCAARERIGDILDGGKWYVGLAGC